ncbi:MAG: glycerol-3-phosphate acyltransferase [Planctomycetota bacterium]
MGIPALLLSAYLVGGAPFAYFFVRATHGIDLRATGSGNVGATNAARLYKGAWRVPAFLFIFGLDAAKGYLATTFLPGLFELEGSVPAVAAGAAAVLGHAFSPFLHFHGGKGVATTVGALWGLEPVATLLSLGAFFAALALTRTVAAGSLAFAVALPAFVLLRGRASPAVAFLAAALGAFILVRHRSNIARMMQGAAP